MVSFLRVMSDRLRALNEKLDDPPESCRDRGPGETENVEAEAAPQPGPPPDNAERDGKERAT